MTAEAIVEARNRVHEAKSQLFEAQDELDRLVRENAPIKVGDIVRQIHWGGTLEGKVTKVVVRYGTLQYTAVLRKKDGTWGRKEIPGWKLANPEVIGHEEV